MKWTYASLLLAAQIFASPLAISQCSTDFCNIPTPAYDAPSACILSSEHDLDCYYGQTIVNTPISLPPYWCTSVENNQWFAFIASGSDIYFNIETLDCAAGGAIQAAILETADCVNFNFVSDCLGNIAAGTTQTLTNNVPLTPGNVYYLMIDGSAGGQCSFTINGSAAITSGPTNVCIPDGPFLYTTTSLSTWSIFPAGVGTILGSNVSSEVIVNWNVPGVAQICAQGISCPNVPIYCLDVVIGEYVVSSPQTYYLCPGSIVQCGGVSFSAPGTYEVNAPSPSGCDSLIICIIVPIQPNITSLGDVNLGCNETFTACGETFGNSGPHQAYCTSWQGCDSVVSFNLIFPDPFIVTSLGDVNLGCDGTFTSCGEVFSSLGSHYASCISWQGCDSLVNFNLVPPAPPTMISLGDVNLACDGIFTSCGQVFSSLGPHQALCIDSQGCDSLVSFNLVAGEVLADAGSVMQIDCNHATAILDGSASSHGSNFGYSWTTTDGIILSGYATDSAIVSASGTYCLTVTNLDTDCQMTDCTVVTTIGSTYPFQASICESGSYIFNGDTLTDAGTYTATYVLPSGCDSISILDLTIWPPATGTETLTLCEGQTILINGQQVGGGDTVEYVIIGGSIHGCDSIISLIVEAQPLQSSAFEHAICEGETYNFNGQILTNAGVYEAILTSDSGCDSLVTLTLNVLPNSPITNNFLEVVSGYVYNGITIHADTVLTEHLLNINGCDSTIVTSFNVLPNSTQSMLAQLQFEVLPNPTDGAFQVHFHLPNASVGSLHLLDIMGREMPQRFFDPAYYAAGEHNLALDAVGLPPGLYLVQFKTDIGTIAVKLIVE